MPRPCKRRRVCALPERPNFGPVGAGPVRQSVPMTVDEFETIRLIDLEGLTQEACAGQMEVSRATVQAIYGSARHKLAQALVQGRELVIGGGDLVLCTGEGQGCGCGHCHKKRGHHKEDQP